MTGDARLPPALARPFRAIVFDWDGTAVVDRRQDATELARVVQALLRQRVWIIVVTGTHVGHIERQLVSLIPPEQRGHLLICTNRGSEVFAFDRRGNIVRRWLRTATPTEDRALTAIAEAVRDAIVTRTGLDVRIVYNRLNRRKIDLIPVPEWADPPKERIGALLEAVEARLHAGGIRGGLGEIVRLTEESARRCGLPDARITSDVKHVEVGLTDKGDSLEWIKRELLVPNGIPLDDVLIAGDEFGPIAGFPGSDDRLRAGAGEATVVSVGTEPNGVPPGVIHLGGGPSRFLDLLRDQVSRHGNLTAEEQRQRARSATAVVANGHWLTRALTTPTEPSWRLTEHGYRPALEHEVESRFSVVNGFLGVRGSLEFATSASRPRTYVAGLYETPAGPRAVPALVVGPDWLRLSLTVNGEPIGFETGEALAHSRTLDLQRGTLIGEWLHRGPAGQTTSVRTLRFVSLADRALGVMVAELKTLEPADLVVETWLESPADALQLVRAEPDLTVWRTRHAGRELAMATATRLQLDGRDLTPRNSAALRRCWAWSSAGQPAAFTRVVAVARGDHEADPAPTAHAALQRARRRGPRQLLAAHARAWAERWSASDVAVDGDEAAQRALRFALYHLNSAANPDDERVSIGARSLTGDGYLGHVFWDTEIFLLPFYTFTWPAAARALLMYRYYTLSAARRKAARLGYQGAFYAWESTDTGEEATPTLVVGPDGEIIPIRCGTDELHISADIAYAIWQYWQTTGDTRFLLDAGAEIILETARFWASRLQLEADGRYHLRGVIGPDEYHEGVDDNAYTNVMAQWNLERGAEVARLLQRRWPERWASLSEEIGMPPDEPESWLPMAARIHVGLDPATGLFEQFTGFFDLEPVDLATYEPRSAPMDVILGRERTQRSQVIKQADVVMLFALLEDRFPEDVRRANFRYYEPRCGHGSSLSPPVHAVVAARLGDISLAERYFRQTAAIDLDDTMGNAAQGVHIAALGGLWQAAVFGFAGLTQTAEGLRLAPNLPSAWQALRFPIQWRGRRLRVAIEQEPQLVTATLEHGRPLRLSVGETSCRLRRGESWSCRYDPANDGGSRR